MEIMMTNYPYEKEFQNYCKKIKHYADSTLLIVNRSIITFWNFFKNSTNEEPSLSEIQASDIQNFLNSLEEKLHLKESTINKYISHIRLYFSFLYSHHLIEFYPMLEINGRKFNRQKVYVIDWMEKFPEIIKIPNIHPETIMMMVGISQGFNPNEVLKLRYFDIINKILNTDVKDYIKTHLNFEKDDNPYILGKKFGGYYPSDFHLAQRCFPDRKLIGMDITLQNLRLSFVYSILNRKNMTDDKLEKILRVDSKSLFYYRENMMRYNKLVEFKLPK